MSENASEAGVQEISGFVLSEQFPEVARVFYFCSLEIIHKISQFETYKYRITFLKTFCLSIVLPLQKNWKWTQGTGNMVHFSLLWSFKVVIIYLGFWKGFYAISFIVQIKTYSVWFAFKLYRFQHMGGKVLQRAISSFDEVDDCDLVINCLGFGAKYLCSDQNLVPIRGQVYKVITVKYTVNEYHLVYSIIWISLIMINCVNKIFANELTFRKFKKELSS